MLLQSTNHNQQSRDRVVRTTYSGLQDRFCKAEKYANYNVNYVQLRLNEE